MITLRPQIGPQTAFHQSSADIVIYGGAASGGKSWSLCIEALRHIDNPEHKAVIFRRTSPMLRAAGSIYHLAKELYLPLGAKLNDTQMKFTFPSGASITFSHMQTDAHRLAWQGTEISYLGFDEATHFSEIQCTYLLSRLRNMSIKPYARLTCNPDSTSFIKSWIRPYLDSAGQFADVTKCGLNSYIGFNDKGVSISSSRDTDHTLSLTFIPASISDNQILTSNDPSYVNKLKALPLVERKQLLEGDWNTSYSAGEVFRRAWFKPYNQPPITGAFTLAFDLAGTVASAKNRDPDWSAATLIQRNGFNTIVHKSWKVRKCGGEVYQWMQQVAQESKQIAGMNLLQAFVEQEPGSASKREVEVIQEKLSTLVKITGIPSTGSKVVRARDCSAAAEQGKIFMCPGSWNEDMLVELESFPGGNHDDMVDSLTLAYNQASKVSLY